MTTATVDNSMTSGASRKLGLGALTAVVIGSMIGSGVFSLPAEHGSRRWAARDHNRLGHKRRRNTGAGIRLSGSRDKEACARCRPLCLRQSRLRAVHRLQQRLGLLALRLDRQRLLCRGHVQRALLLLPLVRRRQHLAGDPRRLRRALAHPRADPLGRASGRLRQSDNHHRQDCADRTLHRDRWSSPSRSTSSPSTSAVPATSSLARS